jgi:hypothetical protein
MRAPYQSDRIPISIIGLQAICKREFERTSGISGNIALTDTWRVRMPHFARRALEFDGDHGLRVPYRVLHIRRTATGVSLEH